MGDPHKPKKTYHRPRRIWTIDQLNAELYILGTYGLRNKRELWKAQSEIARIRNQARALLAIPTEVRRDKELRLLGFLNRLGLVNESATLDDVLNLKIEDILERRLQTIVMRKIMSKSAIEARQIVSHRHVSVGSRTVNLPGYIVRKDEEQNIVVHKEPIKAQAPHEPN
ncbi:MAG TPA: 30S ribosomal protein S4 [Nitrososphaeraceae archaeon]